ncbi:MAG: hypothetical protein ICV78_22085 [Tolypothrix sp. Co-bin9]|nr:hypothetical protein [Tolypothrix sp. Co-bin9]
MRFSLSDRASAIKQVQVFISSNTRDSVLANLANSSSPRRNTPDELTLPNHK